MIPLSYANQAPYTSTANHLTDGAFLPFQTSVVGRITNYNMWNDLGSLHHLRHWNLESGMLAFLFLGLISMRILANGNKYRTVETYMRNSTLVSTENHFRSVLEAVTACHTIADCRAASEFKEMNGKGVFGLCKCTDAMPIILSYVNSGLYPRINGMLNTCENYC